MPNDSHRYVRGWLDNGLLATYHHHGMKERECDFCKKAIPKEEPRIGVAKQGVRGRYFQVGCYHPRCVGVYGFRQSLPGEVQTDLLQSRGMKGEWRAFFGLNFRGTPLVLSVLVDSKHLWHSRTSPVPAKVMAIAKWPRAFPHIGNMWNNAVLIDVADWPEAPESYGPFTVGETVNLTGITLQISVALRDAKGKKS